MVGNEPAMFKEERGADRVSHSAREITIARNKPNTNSPSVSQTRGGGGGGCCLGGGGGGGNDIHSD